MSNVATLTKNLTKKLAFAGNLRLKSCMWVESCSPLIMLHRWFSDAARIKFTMKLPPITENVVSSVFIPTSSIALASSSDGIYRGTCTSKVVSSAIAYPYSSVNWPRFNLTLTVSGSSFCETSRGSVYTSLKSMPDSLKSVIFQSKLSLSELESTPAKD